MLKKGISIFLGLFVIIITYIMSGKFLFFDISAIILGIYLIIESVYSCKEGNEPLPFVYLKMAIGCWFVGEHTYLIIMGRC